MKKLLITIALLCTCSVSYAQDTVHMSDPWYYIETQDTLWLMPAGNFEQIFTLWYNSPGGNGSNMAYIKPWLNLDSSDYLYGVAITAYNFPEDTNRMMISPMLGLHRTIGASNSINSHLRLLDSLTIDNTMKKCWFEYDRELEYYNIASKPRTEVAPTTEFYFDTPYCIDSLPDTFFTSILWREENRLRYLDCMPYSWTLNNADSLWFNPIHVWSFHVAASSCFEPTDFHDILYYGVGGGIMYFFGPLFPIVKLRCTAPYPRYAGHGDNSATITWWQAERGESYQLSLGPYRGNPDSGMLVTPVDTFYTFTGLQTDSIYSAWVRKACRYTTAGYDTLVWSDWSRPVIFRASVGIGEVDDMTLQVTARDGGIAVQGLAAGERAEVFDMQGRRVASLPSDGVTPPLPQGVYLLRTTAHSRARKVVLLR